MSGSNPSILYIRVFFRQVALRNASGVTYLLGDHLGSASLTTDNMGSILSQARYKPFGGTRLDTGVATDLQFTGQRRETGIGLRKLRCDYGARSRSVTR